VGRALDVGLELTASIARNAPLGIEAVKRMLRLAPGRTEEELWPAQRELVDAVFHSEDAQEIARSFAERRAPEWTGRSRPSGHGAECVTEARRSGAASSSQVSITPVSSPSWASMT
jgi:hypothetical protein